MQLKRQRGHLLTSSPFASQASFSIEEGNRKGALFSFPFACKDSWILQGDEWDWVGVGGGAGEYNPQDTAFIYDLHLEFETILKTLERHW